MSQTDTVFPALYTDRDISWLSFNERVLMEAAANRVPLLEKIRFLSIYSSNLDEFYRVRIPALTALKKLTEKKEEDNRRSYKKTLKQINDIVYRQQQIFGNLLKEQILPGLEAEDIHLIYDKPIPEGIKAEAKNYFFTRVLTYIKCMELNEDTDFFSENNKLYFLVSLTDSTGHEVLNIVNIPSEEMPRFYSITNNEEQYILFIDDMIMRKALLLKWKRRSLNAILVSLPVFCMIAKCLMNTLKYLLDYFS
jgi:polyphosphate kinase